MCDVCDIRVVCLSPSLIYLPIHSWKHTSVNCAVELNCKLSAASEHRVCLLERCQKELDTARAELVTARVQVASRVEDGQAGAWGDACGKRARAAEQELRMVCAGRHAGGG